MLYKNIQCPKVRAYFGHPVTKSLDSPMMWHLLILAPIGANVNATYVMISWPNTQKYLDFCRKYLSTDKTIVITKLESGYQFHYL